MQLILFITFVSASNNQTEKEKKPLIILEFIDFQKEVKNVIPSIKEPIASTTTAVSSSVPSLTTDYFSYLEPGISAGWMLLSGQV